MLLDDTTVSIGEKVIGWKLLPSSVGGPVGLAISVGMYSHQCLKTSPYSL